MERAKSKKRKVGKGFKFFSLLTCLISLLLLGKIIYLNILSDFLLIIVISLFLLVNFVCSFLLLKTRKKKIGLLLSTIFIIIYSITYFFINKTTTVFEKLNLDYKTYNYSIVVLKTSNYDSLKDLENKKIGYYNEESEETNKSLSKIKKKITPTLKKEDDIHILRDNLINESVDAILIEKSYLDILNENILENNISFKSLVKEIYTFTIKVKIDDISKDLNVTKEPFNIYISGIDTYGSISSVSRSDVNMVVTINPSTNQVLLTSIPRDYYVKLYNKTGYKDKITHAGLYGVETSIKTIEDLLDIEINYYLKVNFTSVIDIVNAIGGVNVYSDYDFTSIDNIHYNKGYNDLNGEQALSFARERKAFAIGDRQRVKNQQALLNAIIDKCLSPSIIKNYNKLLDTAQNSFVTNMRMSRITSLIKMQLSNNYSWNIISNSLNGIDYKNYTYSAPNTKVYVMSPVTESLDYAIKLINKTESGQILDKTTIEEEQKDITIIVNQASLNPPTDITAPSKDTTDEEKDEPETNERLTAKLVKSSVEFTKGDEYIYHGITATYDNKDVTKDDKLKLTFRVKNEEFTDYRDLIYHISNQEVGNYVINYIISYKEQEVILNQNVTIKKQVTNNSQSNNETNEDITNKNETNEDNLNDYEVNNESNNKVNNEVEE